MWRQEQLPVNMRRRQLGVGLIEALVAILVLAFGLIGMTRLQARMLAQGTEAQNRLIAGRLADQLLSMALVDPATNASCYTVPAAGTCAVSAARSSTQDWKSSVQAALPFATDPTATLNTAGTQLTVTISWGGKAVQDSIEQGPHQLTRTTDVR
jgi:type IV pilus assembly protein PilV